MVLMPSTVFLITGSNRGIGYAVVEALLQETETNVVIATIRDPHAAAKLDALRKVHDGRLFIVKMDVGDLTSIKNAGQLIKSLPIVAEHGIDVLCNNAGITDGAFEMASEISVKALDAALRVNMYGPIFVSQTFLPEVLRSRLKTVVLISSNASSFGLKIHVKKPGDLGAYSISKAAANNFFLRLGQEVEKDGARVIVYHPGTVRTNEIEGLPTHNLLSPSDAAQAWINNIVTNLPSKQTIFIDEKGKEMAW